MGPVYFVGTIFEKFFVRKNSLFCRKFFGVVYFVGTRSLFCRNSKFTLSELKVYFVACQSLFCRKFLFILSELKNNKNYQFFIRTPLVLADLQQVFVKT